MDKLVILKFGDGDCFSLGILLSPSKKGVLLDKNHKNTGLEILDVFQNSTAIKAGLKPGDIILEIDGHKVFDITLNQAYKFLVQKGSGNPVKLKVKTEREHLVYITEEKT